MAISIYRNHKDYCEDYLILYNESSREFLNSPLEYEPLEVLTTLLMAHNGEFLLDTIDFNNSSNMNSLYKIPEVSKNRYYQAFYAKGPRTVKIHNRFHDCEFVKRFFEKNGISIPNYVNPSCKAFTMDVNYQNLHGLFLIGYLGFVYFGIQRF